MKCANMTREALKQEYLEELTKDKVTDRSSLLESFQEPRAEMTRPKAKSP